jgi:hypothetical protein
MSIEFIGPETIEQRLKVNHLHLYSNSCYGLEGRGSAFKSAKGQEFPIFVSSRPTLGPAYPSTQWITGVSSLEQTGAGHKFDHLPSPTS